MSKNKRKRKEEKDEVNEMVLHFIDDVQQIILEYCNLHIQIQMCLYNPKLKIIDLWNIPYNYKRQLNDEILKQPVFDHVKKLDVYDNLNITNINCLVKLEELCAICTICGCAITDQSIQQCINIKKLIIEHNTNITNINHLLKLEELDASGDCCIHDKEMQQCIKIKKLDEQFIKS